MKDRTPIYCFTPQKPPSGWDWAGTQARRWKQSPALPCGCGGLSCLSDHHCLQGLHWQEPGVRSQSGSKSSSSAAGHRCLHLWTAHSPSLLSCFPFSHWPRNAPYIIIKSLMHYYSFKNLSHKPSIFC